MRFLSWFYLISPTHNLKSKLSSQCKATSYKLNEWISSIVFIIKLYHLVLFVKKQGLCSLYNWLLDYGFIKANCIETSILNIIKRKLFRLRRKIKQKIVIQSSQSHKFSKTMIFSLITIRLSK